MLNLKNTLDGYLKNIEVIGNTIQDTNNLTNIRSVGDKVEGQELYKIELACYGDNILRPDFELGLWNVSNGTAQADSTAIRTKGFLRIRNQTHLVKRFDGKLGCQVILFDGNFKYLGQQSYAGGNYVRYDNILPNAKYMKINFLNTTDLNLQCVLFDRVPSNINGVEFVEFQESELEILSPVQLEKVGNVVDRIICKDGVWGVDKKVDAEVKNNVLVNTRTNSEFIPLPHDQQVKLRTFAGQTNIAFLTEIVGQIKAQVPKSLGATVNTHTEQIVDLHNSLERVKKLEETTVSTIETESNFTTVGATSNGYFEDVKLEGKTLVNLYVNKNKAYHADYIYDSSEILNLSLLKPSTKYTLIAVGSNKIYQTSLCNSTSTQNLYVRASGNTCVFTTPNDFSLFTDNIRAYVYSQKTNPFTEGEEKNINILILEGDHTNNPPEFFEGLMSVGQDVKEVSVESVNENLFSSSLYKGVLSTGTGKESSGTRYAISGYFICPYDSIYFGGDNVKQRVVLHYDKYKNYIGFTLVDSNSYYTLPANSYYARIRLDINGTEIFDIDGNLKINLSRNNIEYIPHQSNKKPLLYFNPTTETWEKPVLREWDTIEKHSDGKYYYHKRSGEIVLNGSESWTIGTELFKENCYYFKLVKQSVVSEYAIGGGKHICNKYMALTDGRGGLEGIAIAKGNGINTVEILELKTKFTSYDNALSSFKERLSNSNVVIVYQLAQEEVYECTNIDLMTYSGETNYIINSGAIPPKSLLKVHNNISNVVKILQEKVSLLENTFIAGLKSVLSGDMYSLATILYPEDFEQNDNTEQDITVIPE